MFFLSAFSGILCAFLYDCFKIIRHTFRTGKAVTFLLDMLFWILSAFCVFGMLLYANYGRIRLFELLAVLLGAALYFLSISGPIVWGGTFLFSYLIRSVFFVCKLLVFPFRMLFIHLLLPFGQKTAKIFKKIPKNRLTTKLFWFKINKGMVFFRKFRSK